MARLAGLAGPLASLSILLGCSILTGVAFDASWMARVPMVVFLCGAVSATSISIWKSNVIQQHPNTVCAVTAPLSLAGIVSLALSVSLCLGWGFTIPSAILLLFSAIILIIALCYSQVKAKFQNAGPAICISTLICCSILSGVAIEFSWISGGLALLCLCGVCIWTCLSVKKWQKNQQNSTALITLTIIEALCGVASVLCTLFFPLPVITLNIVLFAAVPLQCLLFALQWSKVCNHLRTVVAVTAPLTLVGVVSTGFCFHIGRSALPPSCLFLLYSLSLLILGLHQTKMIECNRPWRIASFLMLPICGAAAFLTFFLAPLFFPMAVTATIAAVPFIFLVDHKTSETFILLTIALTLYGVALVLCSLYFPPPVLPLSIIVTAALILHGCLLVPKWPKICKYSRVLVAISTLMLLIGVVTTGLSFSSESASVAPSLILIKYSALLLTFSIYESKLIKYHLPAIIALLVQFIATIALFVTDSQAPRWTPVAFITSLGAVPLVIAADFLKTGTFAGYGIYTAMLHVLSAAYEGINWNVCTGISNDFSIAMVQLIIQFFLGIHWIVKAHELDLSGKPKAVVKHPALLVLSFVIATASVIGLVFAFHLTNKTMLLLVPFILVGISVSCIIALHIAFCFRSHFEYTLTGCLIFAALTVYCYCLSLYLAGKPGAREFGFEVHALGLVMSMTLFYHCLVIAGTGIAARNGTTATPAAGAVAAAAIPAPVAVERDVDSDYESVASDDR